MKKINFLALAIGTVLCGCVTGNHRTESSFTSLFNGENLDGWNFVGKGEKYQVENGNIVAPLGVTGDLFSDKEYSDFILRLEYKLTPGGNNGVAIRSPLDGGQFSYVGMEIQLIDDNSPKNADIKPWQKCGSVYGLGAAKSGSLKPAGEWNEMEITAIGRRIKIRSNGKLITDVDLNTIRDPALLAQHPGMLRTKGHVGFLGHHDRVEFRNIRIKELPHYFERDNVAPEGFTALFNGKNLDGWKGLVADPIKRAKMSPDELKAAQVKADELMRKDWTVEDGKLAYHGAGFDNLCSAKDFGDFEMLVDFKIPPKGDSGIYLRGSPQVQIWEPNSGGVDPNHLGSGGLYNNQKNQSYALKFADHYPGEWNRFRILMTGEKVHVFLNDELVVNNVTMENYWDRSQPIFSTGAIELQAHHNPVYFKNVYVREIPREEIKK